MFPGNSRTPTYPHREQQVEGRSDLSGIRAARVKRDQGPIYPSARKGKCAGSCWPPITHPFIGNAKPHVPPTVCEDMLGRTVEIVAPVCRVVNATVWAIEDFSWSLGPDLVSQVLHSNAHCLSPLPSHQAYPMPRAYINHLARLARTHPLTCDKLCTSQAGTMAQHALTH